MNMKCAKELCWIVTLNPFAAVLCITRKWLSRGATLFLSLSVSVCLSHAIHLTPRHENRKMLSNWDHQPYTRFCTCSVSYAVQRCILNAFLKRLWYISLIWKLVTNIIRNFWSFITHIVDTVSEKYPAYSMFITRCHVHDINIMINEDFIYILL